MNNIFENAYFGKTYKTRDGRKAIYVGGCRCVIENDTNSLFRFRSNGMSEGWATGVDIVAEWDEEIDERALDKLAELESPFCFEEEDFTERNKFYQPAFVKGFKAGYRKAKKE